VPRAKIGIRVGFLFRLGKQHSSPWIYRLGKKFTPWGADEKFRSVSKKITIHFKVMYQYADLAGKVLIENYS
jgi:hypothetical protein